MLAAPLIDIAFGNSSLRSSGDTVVGTLRPQAASKSARKELTWDDEKLLGLMLAA